MVTFRWLTLAVIGAATLMSASAWASSTEERNQIERIKLSLRQATLIQTMTSSACLTMGGFDTKSASNAALDDLDTFKTVLAAFHAGHEWLGLLPETDSAVLAQVSNVDAVWNRYRPAVEQLVAGDHHTVVISQLLSQTATISEASNALAAAFITHYGSRTVERDLGRALEEAARHMMLSQRVVKEICYAHFGLGGAGLPAELRRTIQTVDAGFTELSEGSARVPAPPNARVKRNLRTAALFWDKVKSVAEPLANGETVTKADLQKALKMNKSVLKQLNQALESYLVGL